MEKKLYSTVEAAKILGISRIAVFQKIRSGEIAATKVGRNYVIERDRLFEAVGEKLGEKKKRQVETAVSKTIQDYGEALKKLGRE